MDLIANIQRLSKCKSVNLFLVIFVAAISIWNISQAQDEGGQGEVVPYPTYHTVPRGLPFTCADKLPGYYADPDTQCQVWHWCVPSGHKYSFLCPNGTVFNQAFRVCDWFYNVNCEKSTSLYSINDDLYKDKDGILIQG